MKNTWIFERRSRLAIILSGVVCAGLGLTGLVGWYARSLTLIQIFPASPPMTIDAGLGFLLCGTGLLAIAYSWLTFAHAGGGLVIILGLTSLGQYLLRGDLIFGQTTMNEAVARFGLMPPPTAFGFVLGGAALCLVSKSVWSRVPSTLLTTSWLTELRLGVLWLSGILILAVGFLTFSLYLTGTMTTYGWGQVIRVMAAPAAAGFAVLGAGVLAVAWYESSAILPGTPRWIPILVGAGTVTASLLLWQALLVQEHEHIEKTTRTAAVRINSEVVANMDARILTLVRMARRWEQLPPPSQEQWEFEAGPNLSYFPGYRIIMWIDQSLQTSRLVSRQANQTLQNLNVVSQPAMRKALEAARKQRSVTVTTALDMGDEGEEFVVFVPLLQRQNFSGCIIGVFNVQDVFDAVLKNIAPEYTIIVFDNTQAIYRRYPASGQNDGKEWRQEMAIDAYGVSWRLHVWPQPAMLAEDQSALPTVVLAAGCIMAALLTFLVADLIARKEAEAALRNAHAELEQRVRERTAELAQVNKDLRTEVLERKWAEKALARQAQELARSNTELEQFAHVASHDLQEPLRKILAFGDRLKTSCGRELSDRGNDYVERMQVAALRMQNLITDLLTLSRITTRPQPFVPVDLTQIAREAISDMEVSIQEVGGQVHLDPLPTLEADPVQMRQLLQNLIGNALKFHRSGEPPVVQVHAVLSQDQNGDQPAETDQAQEAHKQQRCEIQVEDNGIGFDEKYLDRIFAPFQRLHGRGEYQGTGMGLAICRKIAERHRGQITARSQPGQGTIFSVTLPLHQPQRGKRDENTENTHRDPDR